MSNSAESLQEAFSWASVAGHEAWEFTKFVTKYSLMHGLGYVVGAGVTGAVAAWSIHTGVFHEKTINIGQTIYTKTGEINPATGREWVTQQLITLNDKFTFQGAFHGPVGRSLGNKLAKAAKITTAEERLVLDNLKKVVGEKEFEKIDGMIASHWKGHFSTRLNDGMPPQMLGDHDSLPYKLWFAVPVVEKTHHGESPKILYVPPSFLKEGCLPHPDDLMVETGIDDEGKPIFEYKPDHPDAGRLTTNLTIAARINEDPAYWRSKWLIKDFDVPKARVIETPSARHHH